MIFTVAWKEEAEDELARLWDGSDDKRSMTWASDRIDIELRRDGHIKGRSRPDGRRILIVPPLAVLFEASEPDRMIVVGSVWQVPLRQ